MKESTTIEAGTKIKYCLPDAKGKMHWFNGVVHAVRNYENENQVITKTTYLVDTGRDERVDETVIDQRDIVAGQMLEKMAIKRGPGADIGEMVREIVESGKLPESNPQVEIFRQPEQIELPASQIKVV